MRTKRIQRKHISDAEVIEAWLERECDQGPELMSPWEVLQSAADFFLRGGPSPPEIKWIYDYLPQYPVKVVLAKMEQMVDRGLMNYGVSLRTAWVEEDALARHLTRTA